MKNNIAITLTILASTQGFIGHASGLPDIIDHVRFNDIPADLCHYGGMNTTFRFINKNVGNSYDTLVVKVTGLLQHNVSASNANSLQVGTVQFTSYPYWVYASVMGMNQQQFGFDAYSPTQSIQVYVPPYTEVNRTPASRWSDESDAMAVNVATDIADTYPIRLTCYGYGNNAPSSTVISGSVEKASAGVNLSAALVTLTWKDLN